VTIRERLATVLKELGITPYQLAKAGGDNPTKIYNILNGKARPSYDTLESLLEQYPQINLNWLVSGVGEMFNGDSSDHAADSGVAEPFTRHPFVSIKGQAPFVKGYAGDCNYDGLNEYPVYLGEGTGYPRAAVMEVEGNSMSPRLVHGTKVLAICIDKDDWCYQASGIYAVMYRDYFVIRRIKDNDLLTRNMLTLHSDNPEAGSMPVPAKDIRGIWKVVKVVEAPVD
jgi:phage repressor protein C with HTH and peptisase S24 domain